MSALSESRIAEIRAYLASPVALANPNAWVNERDLIAHIDAQNTQLIQVEKDARAMGVDLLLAQAANKKAVEALEKIQTRGAPRLGYEKDWSYDIAGDALKSLSAPSQPETPTPL